MLQSHRIYYSEQYMIDYALKRIQQGVDVEKGKTENVS